MKKIILPFITVVAVTLIAIVIFHQPERYPSSIKSPDGIVPISSGLNTDETKKQIKRYILGSLKWDYSDAQNLLSLKMGDLKIKTSQGLEDFCIVYPQITTTFEAPEISYSGEHPQITTQLPCDPSQLDFDFSFLSSDQGIEKAKTEAKQTHAALKFSNWEDETPTIWRIKQMYFSTKDSDQSNSLDLTKYEILALLGRPVEFKVNKN